MSSFQITSSKSYSKPWWKKYGNTLVVFLGSFSFAGYLIAFHLSNPIPNKENLIKIPIKVISVQNLDPHLLVQLEDGEKQTMEFPVVQFLKGKTYYAIDDEAKKKLQNCMGYARGVKVKLALSARFRVWDISCGDVNLTYEEASSYWHKRDARLFQWSIFGYLILMTLVSALLVWIERRKK